ncbi:MAG: hypothetical protein LBJ71_03955 [Holosporaceae bacterium]|jgi:hypothetical protein|nr:hypothetical protein [Holosporaceae bacterium]
MKILKIVKNFCVTLLFMWGSSVAAMAEGDQPSSDMSAMSTQELFSACREHPMFPAERARRLQDMGAMSTRELATLPGFSECSPCTLRVFQKGIQLMFAANWPHSTATGCLYRYFQTGGEQRHAFAVVGSVVRVIDEKCRDREFSKLTFFPQTLKGRINCLKKRYGASTCRKAKFFFSRMSCWISE